MEGEVLTVQELARILRVNASTIYRPLKRGGLPTFRVGSGWRFDRDSVEAWLKSQMVGQKDWRLLVHEQQICVEVPSCYCLCRMSIAIVCLLFIRRGMA
jgi:excisionase family DNA binding protein